MMGLGGPGRPNSPARQQQVHQSRRGSVANRVAHCWPGLPALWANAPMYRRFANQLPSTRLPACSARWAMCRTSAPTGTKPPRRPQWLSATLRTERGVWTAPGGLVPHFITKDLKKAARPINAGSETVASSGMFHGTLA
jgi:hypothetical protein